MLFDVLHPMKELLKEQLLEVPLQSFIIMHQKVSHYHSAAA